MSRINRLKTSFRHALQNNFFVRAHMFVILFTVVSLGVLTSWILLQLRIESMPIRYGISVVTSYLFFLVAVYCWISYVSDRPSCGLTDMTLDAYDIDQLANAASPSVAGSQSYGSSSGGSSSLDLGDDLTGVIIVVVTGVAVAIFLGVGIYLVWEAPVILGEAAFQAILAGSLRRRARAIDAPGWVGSVFKATAIPLVIALATAVAAGAIMQGLCTGAVTVAQVIDTCVLK